MRLHPDRGGKPEEFRELTDQYELKVSLAENSPLLPDIFSTETDYEYFRSPVVYQSRDNHWYRFEKVNGAYICIDSNHTNLIWEKRRQLA